MKSLFPNDSTAIFKVSFRNIAFFMGYKIQKENHKKHQLRDSFKFYCPTLGEVYPQQKLIQVLSKKFWIHIFPNILYDLDISIGVPDIGPALLFLCIVILQAALVYL